MRQPQLRINHDAETAGARRTATLATHGHRPGDSASAAEAIITAVGADEPPPRLRLGKAAHDIASTRLGTLTTTFDT